MSQTHHVRIRASVEVEVPAESREEAIERAMERARGALPDQWDFDGVEAETPQ